LCATTWRAGGMPPSLSEIEPSVRRSPLQTNGDMRHPPAAPGPPRQRGRGVRATTRDHESPRPERGTSSHCHTGHSVYGVPCTVHGGPLSKQPALLWSWSGQVRFRRREPTLPQQPGQRALHLVPVGLRHPTGKGQPEGSLPPGPGGASPVGGAPARASPALQPPHPACCGPARPAALGLLPDCD